VRRADYRRRSARPFLSCMFRTNGASVLQAGLSVIKRHRQHRVGNKRLVHAAFLASRAAKKA
jgi:hypothetical protein